MRYKEKKKKRKNSRQFNERFKKRFFTRRSGIIWIFTFIILLGMAIGCLRIERRLAGYQEVIDQLNEEIEELHKTNDALEEQMNNVNTDDYIEKIARERLGMVKKGEYSVRESKEPATTEAKKDTGNKQTNDKKSNNNDSSNSSTEEKEEYPD